VGRISGKWRRKRGGTNSGQRFYRRRSARRLYDKAKMISETREGQKFFASNHLNEVKIRFYGDTAVAQGSESWERRTGERGRFVWTDTWIHRNGRWEIVAAEDLTVSENATGRPQQ